MTNNTIKVDITKYFLDIFQPLVNDEHRIKLLLGGRAGGKSVFTARKIRTTSSIKLITTTTINNTSVILLLQTP